MKMIDMFAAMIPQSMQAHVMSGNSGRTIETHIYATPMAAPGDLYSIGVLNVTKTESQVIEQLARALQLIRDRGADNGDFIKLEIPRGPPRMMNPRTEFVSSSSSVTPSQSERNEFIREVEAERQRALLLGVSTPQTSAAPVIGDRFSGIEFDEQ